VNSVVSVNVGLPRDVEWQGKVVRTAIWKKPVAGRVMARRLNLDGDGQGDVAGHGGEHRAVMVYQLDSYRYWQDQLVRHDFEYGQFGENLTVEGLLDNEVCIGDRYRIGGALFESLVIGLESVWPIRRWQAFSFPTNGLASISEYWKKGKSAQETRS
jgi:MOSC domain-containing protein YiiM